MNWAKKDELGKSINFHWFEEDGAIDLGAPENISAEKGNFRDGGCQLKFMTTESSIGLEEKFALYLYSGHIREVTLEIWEAYLKTEPEKAQKDLKEIIREMKSLAKQK